MKKSTQRLRTEKLINYFAGLKDITRERQYDMLAGILIMSHPFYAVPRDRAVVDKCFDGKLIAERMGALNAEGMRALGYALNEETGRWERPGTALPVKL